MYEEENEYIDGERKKSKLVLIIGIILLLGIILFLIISCQRTTNTKSQNTNLSYLRINNATITPEFNNSITQYNVISTSDYINISCSSESSKATVTGCNSKVLLNEETTKHIVRIKAENGTTKDFTFLIKRTKEDTDIDAKIESTVESGEETLLPIELSSIVKPNNIIVKYEWYKDGKILENNDEANLKVSEPGKYEVRVYNEELNINFTSDPFIVKEKVENKEVSNKETTNNSSIDKYILNISKINGNPTSWVKSATLSVEASTSNGLSAKAYSFDGGKTYQSSNSKTFTSNGNVKIVVKDIKGNTVSKTVNITKIDNVKPKVSISASNKTNSSVVLKANVTPSNTLSGYKYEWYKNGSKISNATSSSYKVTSTGEYKVKVITGTNNTATSSVYKFTKITLHCPMISVTSSNGNVVPPKTWFNEVIYAKIITFDDTKSYDVYLNEYGIFDKVSNKYSYLDTFKDTTKVKIVNNGLRVIKIIIRDELGNSQECYSDIYYLK